MSCGVGRRHSSAPVLLWLWCRLAADSSNSTPSLGTSICRGGGPKETKKKKKIQEHTQEKYGPTEFGGKMQVHKKVKNDSPL